MISRVLYILERGFEQMRQNSRLLLVGVLVFVFPLLFVWATQSFFITSQKNILTTEKARAGMLHDSISALLEANAPQSTIQAAINTFVVRNQGDATRISAIRIFSEDNDNFTLYASTDDVAEAQLADMAEAILEKPFSKTVTFQISEYIINGRYIREAIERVGEPGSYKYIYSQYDYSALEQTMAYRKQQAYYVLTAVFLFIIALAYWLVQQINWEKKHVVLAEKMHERDLFSNMIAHEFRAPLTAIKGYASFLQESKRLDNDEHRFVDNIAQSAERLVLLVNDFLEVARIQSGKLKLDITEVDMRDVLAKVKSDLQGLADEKGLALQYNAPAQPVMFTSDQNRLVQVFTNIVSNAIKYTKEGHVELTCSEMRGGVTIRVKDTGMGISADDQKQLFKPFSRVGGVEETTITGTGLGMWITQQLVEILGGTIGVESIKDVGTHVVINFKD